MAHLQYMPGDPRLVDQLVCELKSKGIFDQFRKECIADVDTRPAYQNLRQRVESSVATFLARQTWKPDLNKNQLREKLRKHLLDGNYLEQGVERIVDQVVNPKVASVFIPQVEDLVYNYLGIPRKKTVPDPETSNGKVEDLLPTDLEAVSPGSVKSNDVDDKSEAMDTSDSKEEKMEIDDEKTKDETKDDSIIFDSVVKEKEESRLSGISELTIHDSDISIDKNTTTIPLPAEEIKLENIPAPENSPPNIKNINIDLEKIDLPKEPNLLTDIPLPDEIPKVEGDAYFKPITNSEEDDTSSDSSLRRNMSPLTPIRNYNNENSCDAQQAFENDSDGKADDKTEPSSFRFTIEAKSENSNDAVKKEEKKEEPVNNYQFNTQVTTQVNTQVPTNIANVNFNTPLYDDSSNSNNLQIDYESDANSKAADIKVPEVDQSSKDSHKKEKKEESRSSHKSSHRSRDSHRHSSSKDKRSTSTSKHSSSRDSSRHDKKSKDDKSKSSHKEKTNARGDKNEKKESRDSSKHRSSSSYKSSSHRDSKDSKHRSSSSKHSSSSKDDKKSSSSSSSQKDKEKTSSSSRDKDKSKDSKSSSRDKDRKSSSSSKKSDEKENKERKDKKDVDDHYSLSGRGNPNRRSTDRDSNDGSSSSKGSHKPSNSKSSENKKESKSSSKSENHSSSGDSASPSDSVETNKAKNISQSKPVVRVDTHLENLVSTPPRLPFVPDVTIKKPRFAANLQEAKQMMKMRKFLEEEQKRMNQEAALLLEFQANVRPSLSQVYSSIPGPELEFACVSNTVQPVQSQLVVINDETPVEKELVAMETAKDEVEKEEDKKSEAKVEILEKHDEISETLSAMHYDGENDIENNKKKESDNKESIQAELIVEDKTPVLETMTDKVENKEPAKHTEVIKEIDIEAVKNTELKDGDSPEYFEVTIITEELSETDEPKPFSPKIEIKDIPVDEKLLKYFAEHEKFDAEVERDKFSTFLNKFTEGLSKKKIYLINCDTYEENLIKEVSETFGQFEIVNYVKNGCVKLPQASKNIVKNVNVTTEITLPTKVDTFERSVTPDRSVMFSPAKSECSFELSSDYDAKLEEMVNRTSRQEIMEIILGSAIEESPSKVKLDYTITTESNIEENCLKRKISEVESTENNNRQVLTPNKLRKISCSDQISSTTEEAEVVSTNRVQVARSKYLGKARRVGLPKPKRANLPNSPSSDKSVENYEQNETPNGKMKSTPRSKVQRYDTSDLYKPKLHYLSRRNNIS